MVDRGGLWCPVPLAPVLGGPVEVVPRPVSEVSSMAADLTALSRLLSSCDDSAPEVSQVSSSSRVPRLRVSGMGAPSFPRFRDVPMPVESPFGPLQEVFGSGFPECSSSQVL